MNKPDIVMVIGRLPPPVGGVSKYVEGLVNELMEDGSSVVTAGGMLRLFWEGVIRGIAFSKFDRIYVNTLHLGVLGLLALCGAVGRVIVVDHNHSRKFYKGRVVRRWIYRCFASKTAEVWVVNHNQKEFYEGLGCALKVVTPFYPPVNEYDALSNTPMPESLNKFVDKHRANFLVAAWKYVPEKDDDDLYGIKLTIRAVHRLNTDNSHKLGLIIAVGTEFDQELDKLRSILTDDCYLLIGCSNLWPLYRLCDVVIRMTTTDGDSVSIREALYAKCNVVASNVVPRPEGVEVIARNEEALMAAIRKKNMRSVRTVTVSAPPTEKITDSAL